MKQELTAILQELSTLNNSLEYEVKLSFKEVPLKFKQLTTKQFNDILGTLIVESNNTDTYEFNKCMCSILTENYIQGDQSIEQLNFFDYVKLVLETRKQCISDNLNIIFSSDDIEKYDLSTSYSSISLTEHLAKVITEQISPVDVTKNNITVTVGVPTIKKIVKLDKDLKPPLNETASVVIKKYFIKEIIKYIDSIVVGNNRLDFENTDVKDFIEVANNLPASLVNEIISHIEKIKQNLNNITYVAVNCKQNSGETVSFNKELIIDGNLFNF